MRAVYIKEFGELSNLEIRSVPGPSAAAGEQVLVRVHAAGLNRADLLQVRGRYPPPAGYSPKIPGLEFAGEITAIGDAVTVWTVGQRVFGITAGEGQAEYLLTHQSLLTAIPDNLNYTEAAAVPEAFITAHDAIFTLGKLKPEETILIHAVASGVGLAALRLAKTKSAVVIGTSRTADKLERCKELGLDASITTGEDGDFAKAVSEVTDGRGVDLILDLVGAGYFPQNLDSLAVQGRLILVGLTSGSTAEFDLGKALYKRATIIGTMLRGRSVEEKAAATEKFAVEVVPLLNSGKVKPNIDRVFPVEAAVEAYSYLASNVSFGKVVLEF